MKVPSEHELVAQSAERLTELVEHPCRELDLHYPWHPVGRPDAFLQSDGNAFMLECRITTDIAALHRAVRGLKARVDHVRKLGFPGHIVPLLAVPFMGDTGRRFCDEEDCSWLDLSGNAKIRAPGLLVRIEGKPNRFKRRGRPASSFAPMASRIARHLLTYPTNDFSQRELARHIGMDEGYVSRIVRNLAEQGLIAKHGNLIRVPDPDLLLRAWLDEYDFSRHQRIAGHIPARDGDELMRALASALADQPHSPRYAATGLAAAWCLGRFSAFRTASVYVHDEAALRELEPLSFRETDRGANVWILVPDDPGVFQGVTTLDHVHCVTTVQIYLDLHAHPERAKEAATEIKSRFLNWGSDDG